MNNFKQALIIAELSHRNWDLKYFPENYRAEDINDMTHPFYNLLIVFDVLRETEFTLDDISTLIILENLLKQIGKIIDNMVDTKGSFVKGVVVFTALAAYVSTVNIIWSKKNQLLQTSLGITQNFNCSISNNNSLIVMLNKWLNNSYLEKNVDICKFIYLIFPH